MFFMFQTEDLYYINEEVAAAAAAATAASAAGKKKGLKFIINSSLFRRTTKYKHIKGRSNSVSVKRVSNSTRHDICHKHHKQRLCKIIITRVKFHLVNVFLEHGCVYTIFSYASSSTLHPCERLGGS